MTVRETKLYYSVLSFLLFANLCSGQLIVENNLTVEEYVQNILLGEGVVVSNITFNGVSASSVNVQVGYFNSELANVGMESGLILASGEVTGVVGPNNDGGFTGVLTNGQSGDPDLELLNPGFSMNDVAILEFDFIPNGDTLSFNYVFGSDEYLEFVNSSFNDAFGFFLCGPGISGPYSTPNSTTFPNGSANIALIPGTTQPVTIDNVNDVANSTYYVNNGDGFSEPQASDDTVIQYDGFTVPLEAFALVNCGETYHIKLAVADAGDTALDSGVFLEEGSFSSSAAIETELQLNIGVTTNVLYENCGIGVLVFTRYGDLSEASTVELVTSGTAINGVDYTNIPSEVFFAPGDSTTSIEISAVADGIPEGTEEVIIDITNTVVTACSNSVTSHFAFDIYDDPEALALQGDSYNIDCGDSVLIGNMVTGGYGNYTYNWYDNGQLLPMYNDSTFMAMPGLTTTYTLVVEDICNAGSISADYLVEVPVYPPLAVDIDPSIDLVCLDQVVINVNSSTGGNGVYSFNWYQDTLVGTGTSIDYTAYNTTQLTVVMTDGCGVTATDVMQINVPPIPIIIQMTEEQFICKGDVVTVSGNVSGGKPPYIYQWNTSTLNTDQISISPPQTQIVELTILDQCLTEESNSTVVNVSDIDAIFTLSELDYYGVDVKNHTQTDSNSEVDYFWDFGDGFTSTEFELSHMYTNLSDHVIALTATTQDGCRDSVSVLVEAPKPIYVPSSFSPNEDGINDLFFVTGGDMDEFEIRIYDRWGRLVYQSFDINEKWNGDSMKNHEHYANIGVYNYEIVIRPKAGEREKLHGSITVLR